VSDYRLGSVTGPDGATPVLVVGDTAYHLPEPVSTRAMLADWERFSERLDGYARRGDLASAGAVSDLRLGPPVPDAPNLYMAGANYADHAREMRKLGPEDPVPKPQRGPFMFLKPTTTMVGHRDAVRIAPGCERVDWEVELAVVIGRRAERVAEAQASDYIAGYMVANDVSVRGSFLREDTNEPPMKFDWFMQKGWATSCPIGPWLVPAAALPGAQDAVMRLSVNGDVQQQSRTSEMIFSIAEQIAFVSAIVPLVPGDIICTGTCAGVGMGRGRFLAPGDVMVAEVEGIGALVNEVVAG
jgi:2-keto-4-pentenoate hydratase/2-oxohepta-3-ene-1,7-dioic acid hydratase in catechol pathway